MFCNRSGFKYFDVSIIDCKRFESYGSILIPSHLQYLQFPLTRKSTLFFRCIHSNDSLLKATRNYCLLLRIPFCAWINFGSFPEFSINLQKILSLFILFIGLVGFSLLFFFFLNGKLLVLLHRKRILFKGREDGVHLRAWSDLVWKWSE